MQFAVARAAREIEAPDDSAAVVEQQGERRAVERAQKRAERYYKV